MKLSGLYRLAFFLWALMIHAVVPDLRSQPRTYTVKPFGIEARDAGLGYSGAAEVKDILAMYHNPGAIAVLERSSVTTAVALMKDGTEAAQVIALPLTVERGLTVGLGLYSSAHGREWSRPNLQAFGFDLGAGQTLSSTVSVGTVIHYRYGTSGSYSASVMSASLGSIYAPTPGVTYGLALRGLGWGLTYRERVSGRNPIFVESISPRVLEIGATFRFPSQYRRPNFAIVIASSRLLGEARSENTAGLEIYPINGLEVRAGMRTTGSLVFGHLGLGVQVLAFNADYALVPDPSGMVSHQLSVGFAIPALGRGFLGDTQQ